MYVETNGNKCPISVPPTCFKFECVTR